MKPITMIGSGLAGPLLATSLVKRGLTVDIFERRPDMRQSRVSEGRSINLALSTRGIYALRQAGLWSSVEDITVPMKGRMMHAVSGDLTFQPYGKDESEVIYSISRAELNSVLVDAAEQCGVNVHFGQRCTGFDVVTGAVQIRDESSGEEQTIDRGPVIAADGANSAVRLEMLKSTRFNFSQEYLDYGYKELTIPAGPEGAHPLDPHALHIWPRGTYMLIALPNIDGSFACILFLPFEGENSFGRLETDEEVLDFFGAHFPDVVPLMPQLTENYRTNPTGWMITVKSSPWHVDGKALLLGDAAHAIVPFFGQGLNCAFEDCTYLLATMDRYPGDWERVFTEFERTRKPDTDAIAHLAIENFIEMRDRVADPRFLMRKKAELALEARYPGRFIPKYSMVTFHRLPYSMALSRGAIQDRILSELCDGIDGTEEIDWNKANALVSQSLPYPESA